MILLLTGLEQTDRRLLQSDIAGSPFTDTLSSNLRARRTTRTHVVGGPGEPSPDLLEADADGVLIADADVWFSASAAQRLNDVLRPDGAPIRLTAIVTSGNQPDVLAVYLPSAAVAGTLKKNSGDFPRRAADVTLQKGRWQDIEASALDGQDPPARLTTLLDLAACERTVLRTRATEALLAGVRIRDPERISIRGELHCGTGVELDVNVIIEGKVVLGENVKIGANSILINSSIGDHTVVKPYTLIENATVGSGTQIGPYGRLRPGSVIGDSVQIGNFVEIKNSEIAAGTRINHLAFVGDSTLGRNVTIGAATITCNHNRMGAARTFIGDGAYVGSGSLLVAPLSIGENATIGAGSTITKDAPAGKLTLARAPQVTVPHWRAPDTDAEKK